MLKHLTTTVNYLNILALMAIIVLSIAYQGWAIRLAYYIFFFSYIPLFILEKKWENFRFDNAKLFFSVLLLFFLMALVSHLTELDNRYTKWLFESRYPLLGFSIVGFWGFSKEHRLSYFFNALIITSIAVIFGLVFSIGVMNFIRDENRGIHFTDARIALINSHMMFKFYLNMAMIAIWYILANHWKALHPILRALYIAAAAIIFTCLIFSDGRSGLAESGLIMISILVFELWKRHRRLCIVTILLFSVGFGFVMSHNSRMNQHEILNDSRGFLWASAFPVIKEHPIVGHGIGEAQSRYDVYRRQNQTAHFRDFYADARFVDCHNQYFQTTMEFGLLGLCVLLFLYLFPIFGADNRRHKLAFLFALLYLGQSFFDMFITGQFAITFCLIGLFVFSLENDIFRLNVQK